VLGYLQDFLFSPERARAPITRLSGGERNRLLLAKLFAQPSNLLVMDEPTNDLDVETLELLEELLAAYQGTLLLVSHDREFIDNVVTSTLVLEGGGRVGEYVGGFSDWLRQRATGASNIFARHSREGGTSAKRAERPQDGPGASEASNPAPSAAADTTSKFTGFPPEARGNDEHKNGEQNREAAAPKRKLSYKDTRELEQLPARIETLENDIAARTAAMNDPAFFRQDSATILAANNELAKLQAELDHAYARWQALES